MSIRKFNFDKSLVTAIVSDGEYSWIAFKGSDDECTLRKVSAFDLNQVFYEITVPVNQINRMIVTANSLIGVCSSATISVIRYDKTNPLNDSGTLLKSPLIENPIDLVVNGSDLFILYPGSASGINTKIQQLNASTIALVQTIDLFKSADIIENAVRFTIDDSGNLWVVTSDSPSLLVNVYDTGGDVYDFISYTITM